MHYGTRYGHAVNALCSEACAVQDCWVISRQFLVQQPWYQAGSVFRACFFLFSGDVKLLMTQMFTEHRELSEPRA